MYVDRLARLAEMCDALAIPVLTLATGTRDPDNLWSHHPDNQCAAALDDLHRSLHALLDATVDRHVALAFEPETANVIQTADQAAALLHEFKTDRLGVILDSANLLGDAPASHQAAVIAHAATVLGGRVALAHAKDCDDSHRVVAPGQGQVDFAAYLAALHNLAGYTGPVIMHGLAPADVPDALTHLTAARAAALVPR
jgi:sugar phosphate isomerase/epimerase